MRRSGRTAIPAPRRVPFGRWLAAGLGSLACASAVAQAPDTSSWVCQYCPFPDGYRAEYTAGADYVSDDSAYLGDATGYDDSGVYAKLSGDGSYLSQRYRARWTVEDLGLDSRALSLAGGRQGLYDFRLSYRELPRREFDTTRTIFSRSGDASLALPAGWQRASLTSGFTGLDAALAGRNIGSDRKTLEMGAAYLPLQALKLSASYQRIERSGVDIAAGSYFTQSSLLPRPLDYSTDNVMLSARIAMDRGYLAAAWQGSFFQNTLLGTSWQSPFLTAAGAETGRTAQAPDNRFQQLSLSGGYRLDGWDTYISFSAAAGRATQDDVFLPYTTNGTLTTAALPRARLDGEVNKRNLALAVSASPLDKLGINARFRQDRSDNDTPVDTWTRVITDTFNSGDAEQNVPYSFRRNHLGVDATYRLSRELRLAGGYDRRQLDRDRQEVAEQTEDSGWGALYWQPNERIDVRAKGGTRKREIDRYDETFADSLEQNPLLRKYNLAYRYRRFAELSVAATATGKPASLSITSMYADDDYTKSPLGLTSGKDLRVSGDLSYAFSDKRHAHLQIGYESIDSTQLGSEQFAVADWRATNADDFLTAGAGVRLLELSENIDVTADYMRSFGSTEIAVVTAAAASAFPDLESTLDSLRLGVSWKRSERLTLNLSARYERFAVEDWALQDVAPDTVPVVLTLGAEPYDYSRFIIGLGFSYRPGVPAAQSGDR